MGAVAGASAWSSHLDDARVREVLVRNRRLREVLPVGEVGSTQDAALASVADGARDGTIVLADRQLAGRGRSGRTWDDDRSGGTLALTVIIDAPGSAATAAFAPHALGLAVVAAAAVVVPAVAIPVLKWPNDVVVRSAEDGRLRKLAGILIERRQVADRDVLLCGIGLNVDLRGPLPPDRICLASLAGAAPVRPVLLAVLLAALDDVIVRLVDAPQALLADYRTRCETIGRAVEVTLPGDRRIVGRAIGVDDQGRLLVEGADGTEVILAGTVRDAAGHRYRGEAHR
jgi:BirA family biotin operon repressor/biotin-[acetyl-CoA-carboxylase] ligase